jgi:hypothetical protein
VIDLVVERATDHVRRRRKEEAKRRHPARRPSELEAING